MYLKGFGKNKDAVKNEFDLVCLLIPTTVNLNSSKYFYLGELL